MVKISTVVLSSIFLLLPSVDTAIGHEDEADIGHLIFVRSELGEMPTVSIRFLQGRGGNDDRIEDDDRRLFSLDFVGVMSGAVSEWHRNGEVGPEPDRFGWRISTAAKGILTGDQVENLIDPSILNLSDTIISTINRSIHRHQGPACVLTTQEKGGRPHYGSFRLLSGIGQYPLRKDALVNRFGITDYLYTKYEGAYLRLEDALNSAGHQERLNDTNAIGLALYLFRQIDSTPVVKGIRSRVVNGVVVVHDANPRNADAQFKREATRQFLAKLTDPDGKITVCHIPPGKGDEGKHGRTIRIDAEDIYDHLEHGDIAGICPARFDDDREKRKKEDHRRDKRDEDSRHRR